MRKIPWILLFLGLIGCNHKDKLVSVVDDTAPKTVMVYVDTVVEEMVMSMDGNGDITVTKSTAATTIYGSGVYISPNGHVLTCAHLVEVGKSSTVTTCDYNNHCQEAVVLYKDHKQDLLLLKIDQFTKDYAKVADPRSLKVGQEVLAIGNPLGWEFSVSHGIISGLNRDQVGYDMTQSDAFLNPGNSGGPLFNMDGELVGINSRIVPPINAPVFTGIGCSVSPSQIIRFLTKFRGLDKSLPKYSLDYWSN